MSLIGELKRRNVIRVGLAYLVGSWLLLQVIDVVGPILRLPEAVARYILFLLVIGLVPALVLAWAFEWTPQGVHRDDGASVPARTGRARTLDRVIMIALALAVALLLYDKLMILDSGPAPLAAGQSQNATAASEAMPDPLAPPPAKKSVAILPFVPLSTGPDDDYFADGLTEEIINALGQAPDLLVTARTSAFHFKGRNLPVADIAQQLGVAHVVEGSVRRAGEQLRIAAQLVRTRDGFQLWSHTYDRRTADTFAVQSDIAEAVARALNVLLDEAARERMQRVGTRDVDAFIAYQKGIELYERAHREPNQISLLRQANHEFDRALERAPSLYQAYDYHSDLFIHVLLGSASGELDGDVTQADLARAPQALERDLRLAVQHARTPAERHTSVFSEVLAMGPWRGLALLTQAAAATPGCEAPAWLHLLGWSPGYAEPLLATLQRMGACDPLRTRPKVRAVGLMLWLGRPEAALSSARDGLQRMEHLYLAHELALAQAFSGDPMGAEREASQRIRTEEWRAWTLAMLAAIRGDGRAAADWQQQYLGHVGGNDRMTLVLEAVGGNRNEANRLARAIDGRPFGHFALLQAIYFCYCGAPFDLEAAPVFASMLAESGLAWPPLEPYQLPLKDW